MHNENTIAALNVVPYDKMTTCSTAPCTKPLLEIPPTGIIVDTDTPVDEVAQKILEILDLNIKKMVQDDSKELLNTLEEILEIDNLQHAKLLVKLTLKDYYNKHSEVL